MNQEPALPVSRETLATSLFGDRTPLMERYAEILAADGVERGMIGPREVPRLWDRHLFNCAVVCPRIPNGADVADVGSGAGLPGLVWAIARPDLRVTLIEPLLRRTRFLDDVVKALDLENVTIARSRAEEVDDRFDVVTARAVARLDKLARWCLPLVAADGVLLALKGSSAHREVGETRGVVESLGARSIVVATYGDDQLDVPTTVVEVTR
ncbi:16S rRNA (guanine(527)-N(7))-methyltransferase RsmG [Aeromicrobium phragmitis]|uniref:Ribosomal RNA small subunit methyltransferase G n=1 Tax=Aeromicrobium phragmitis TaxID=2478914 RepID=A0A3L8PRL3_9ACTN|nr:16S rRNA (guanine(527)-N(7))-methyltransferase RsmG [Aeromicrobium phragmitis]RLV57283.1 16S rRNA (guanine(527)-N(7))-methyltransferase RsmG [Aeromicrobium phragmitis]